MEVTSAVERRGTEPQPSNGHLPRSWPCPQEDRTPSLMGPQPLRAWGMQCQGPSVLESKVRALKEKMTAGKQGASPSLTAHERSAPKKPKCRRVKVGGARTPSEGSPLPDAAVVLHAQNLTDRPRNSSVSEEEAARNGGPGPPRPPAPGLKCWKEKSPWPPEAVWTLPDHERDMLPGPGSLQDSPIHRATPGWPRGPGPCNNVTHAPKPRKGRSYLLWDGLYTGGDLDSLSLTSKEDFVPRPALLGGLWRAADPGALDTGGSVLPLSDRVERNRLLLQEMLLVAGKGPPKVGIPAWTPSWDSTVPERPAGDVDWDSGISLQDSDQNRTFGPKPEPVLRSPRHEEGKHVLQRARVKARTRPLRASHDIVPAVAQGSRDGRRSPALDRRTPLGCRDQLQTGSTSDSSSGESGGGPWPQRGPSPSHVRFEDESAREAESRYLERLQQRQGLSPAPPAGGQGPLRSKPELASYIAGGPPRAEVGDGAPHGLVEPLGQGPLPAPPPTRGSQRTCGGRGSCVEDRRPGLGTAAPHPRALQERKAASGLQALSAEPPSSRGPSAPLRLLPAKPGPRTTRAPETHPEEADSALDSTDTSDSGRTDSEEAGPSPRGGARPRAGRTRLGKAASESARGPGCQAGVDLQEVPDEARDGRGHTPEGAAVPGEEASSMPPVRGAKTASPGSQRHPGPGPGNHGAHPEDSWALVRKACATASLMTLPSPGPHRQPQLLGSRESREAVPLPQNQEERSAPPQAWQPPASLSPKGWVPTPPAPRKTTSPGSHRKAVLAGPRRPGDQGEPADSPLPPSRSEVPTVSELSPPQAEPCSPDVSRPLLTLSTTNCNNSEPRGPQEPWGGAAHEGRVLKGARSREPEAPLENCGDGVGTISSVGITLSLASEEPESSQEPEGGLRRTELSSEVPVSSRCHHLTNIEKLPPFRTSILC